MKWIWNASSGIQGYPYGDAYKYESEFYVGSIYIAKDAIILQKGDSGMTETTLQEFIEDEENFVNWGLGLSTEYLYCSDADMDGNITELKDYDFYYADTFDE